MQQPGFFDLEMRHDALQKCGDPLLLIKKHVNFEEFRPLLKEVLGLASSSRGRPPFDPLLMFKILILQSLYTLSDDQMEFQIKDRFSFMRFLGLEIWDRVPDAKTIWLYRERLKPHLHPLMALFNNALKERGYLAMGGQIVDASVIKAPRQRLTDSEKDAVKAGQSADQIFDHPEKARQKDIHARWRVKQSRPQKAGLVPLAIPEFGYKNHIVIDKVYGFVRGFKVSDAASSDAHQMGALLQENTCSKVWGDSAYFTKDNCKHLKERGFFCHLHRRKPKGKPMSIATSRANFKKSKVRACVEHVFAHQKHHTKLVVRTIGMARAEFKIGMANLAYNMKRLVFWEKKRTLAA